jgi:hypothetical protein
VSVGIWLIVIPALFISVFATRRYVLGPQVVDQILGQAEDHVLIDWWTS